MLKAILKFSDLVFDLETLFQNHQKFRVSRVHTARLALLGFFVVHAITFVAMSRDTGDEQATYLSSGQKITPTAAPRAALQFLNPHLASFPDFICSGGISSAVSPDGKTLLVLVSGYNKVNDSNGKTTITSEYVFVYDISMGKPTEKQVLSLPNTYAGIAFSPSGDAFYVSGGRDDNIHQFDLQADGTWTETGPPIALGHSTGAASTDIPVAAGIAVSKDGAKLAVANLYNDSLSIVDITTRKLLAELDLRPGKNDPAKSGVAGGEYPFWIVFKGNDTIYVSSLRDREIVVVQLTDSKPSISARIKVRGNPNKMILGQNDRLLMVAEDNSDVVSFIDTRSNRVIDRVPTVGPQPVLANVGQYHGITPNSLALSPDERFLYVTNGGTNSVSIIGMQYRPWHVVGLLPTGFYPNAASVSMDGKMIYVVNGKSSTGPNASYYPKMSPTRNATNSYIEDLEKSSLLSFPVPDPSAIEQLTRTVLANNSISAKPHPHDAEVMREMRRRINHVIYIIRENRTYDQLLGDLDRGNGDPNLAEFGAAITPNAHSLAQKFVDLDNFFDSGDVSANGWAWTTSARESDFGTKTVPLNYSGRGTDYEIEGTNRKINVGLPTLNEREALNPLIPHDPDLLPGLGNVAAPDGPEGTPKQKGYIWNTILRAGLKVRNYGCFLDISLYSAPAPNTTKLERYPYDAKLEVAVPADSDLKDRTDPYFRGFDTAFPDFYRELEWEREFDQFNRNGAFPNFELVRFGRNHTGSYSTSLDGTNTPEIQQAENDYAVGRLIERVAQSRYKHDTLIFVIEDDAQDGADHVDSHRSTFFVAGPYVKHGAVISSRYTTVNVVRTIEDLLGAKHSNINTAAQRPIADLFDLQSHDWDFKAVPSAYLAKTQLPIPKAAFASYSTIPLPIHDGAYWAEMTKEFDFRHEDELGDWAKYNRIIWAGVKGDAIPYPERRDGTDLRSNRDVLLKITPNG
jgi:DNA-binding beta-propeller fold protein YncE